LGLAIRKRGVLLTFDAGIAVLLDEKPGNLKSLEILKA
jgi:hypothetical protein